MKNLLFIFFFITCIWSCQAQNKQKFNLGFESQKADAALPLGWMKWGKYDLNISALAHSGDKAGKITSDESGSAFGSIAYKIPANYNGEVIRLEGYMKIENVENGFAGLLLRVDGDAGVLVFDNMQSQGIIGTRDWQKYTITLGYPEGAKKIFVAGILQGKGTAWFDDFVVTIDGKDIQTLKEEKQQLVKAQLDKAFDEGAAIEMPELDEALVNQLELLGRIWGFLKYHHPEIGKGNYNWDYELFRFLPNYLKTKNKEAQEALLLEWITNLGAIGNCWTCQKTDAKAFLKPDLKWIKNGNLGADLKEKLLFIYENRHQGKHYYIGMAKRVSNPIFKNEAIYANMPYPDEGFRLLSLYRYWNMIYYYFPYRHLMDEDWNGALKKYIPTFLKAKNELEYELAALQLIGDIKDTHANLWGSGNKINEWKGTFYPPFQLRFIENKLVITDFYKNEALKAATGLEIGDIITRINGKLVANIIKEKKKYYPASNQPTRLRDLAPDLLRSITAQIRVNYIRGDAAEQSKTLTLYPRNKLEIYRWSRKSNDKCFQLLENNIGYITLEFIQDKDIPLIKEQFKNTKGIIIDIRNYPLTFVPFKLGSYFVGTTTPFVKFTRGNLNNPGEFKMGENLEIPKGDNTYEGKLVVLVNELSQSQAEYTAMAFRAGKNTTIIGSTTAGADGNISTILLPGGLRSLISGIGVYYPNGKETQRVGIIPDIEVHPSIEGIRKGEDELLLKAIDVILKE
jgi:C-terminal processing protease CtpA/Prc